MEKVPFLVLMLMYPRFRRIFLIFLMLMFMLVLMLMSKCEPALTNVSYYVNEVDTYWTMNL